MSDLDSLRKRIDALDRRIVDLLVERLGVAIDVGRRKETDGLAFYDPDRERRVLDRVAEASAGRFPESKLRAIFREIISAARAQQAEETVLVHGAWGSLAHLAAFRRFGASAPLEWTARTEDLFARLEEGSAGYAVVSLEGHSFESSLDRLDLFLHSDVSIFGEVEVPVRIGSYSPQLATEAPAQDRTVRIYATPACLAQASGWIGRQPSDREVRVVGSQADAMAQARASGGEVLGFPLMESMEGWRSVAGGLEDLSESSRRFFVLSRRQLDPTGDDKTLVLAVLANEPGALHEATGILSRRGLNLFWLEPKPTHLGQWDHLFVLEIEGHRNDPALGDALSELKERADLLQVLGSFPRVTG